MIDYVGIFHVVAMAYVLAVLAKPKVQIGIVELSALALVATIGFELIARQSSDLYEAWKFLRNTIGGFGLTWLIFERIGRAHGQG